MKTVTDSNFKPPPDAVAVGDDPWFHSPGPDRAPSPLALPPGTRVNDQYVVEAVIGRGREGVVYRAMDERIGARCALKITALTAEPHEAGLAEARRRCARLNAIDDARHLLRMHEPHLVTADGQHYLLTPMPFMAAGCLARRVEEAQNITLDQALGWLEQACLGLQALHAVDLVHGDIHLGNLLLDGDRVKVADLRLTVTPANEEPKAEQDLRAMERMVVGLLKAIEAPHDRVASVSDRCGEGGRDSGFTSIEALRSVIATLRKRQAAGEHPRSDMQAAVDRGDLETALRLGRQALEKHEPQAELVEMVASLERRRESAGKLYRTVEARMDEAGLETLLSLVHEAVKTYPNHPEGHPIQIVLQGRVRRFREAMEAGWTALMEQQLEAAARHFQTASHLNSESIQAQQAGDRLAQLEQWRQQVRQQIDACVSSGQRERAQSLARQIDTETLATYRFLGVLE